MAQDVMFSVGLPGTLQPQRIKAETDNSPQQAREQQRTVAAFQPNTKSHNNPPHHNPYKLRTIHITFSASVSHTSFVLIWEKRGSVFERPAAAMSQPGVQFELVTAQQARRESGGSCMACVTRHAAAAARRSQRRMRCRPSVQHSSQSWQHPCPACQCRCSQVHEMPLSQQAAALCLPYMLSPASRPAQTTAPRARPPTQSS
jgi:hypothetical protein